MINILRISCLALVIITLSSCNTGENAITGFFANINAMDPLPKNYAEESAKINANPNSEQNGNSVSNRNTGASSSFDQWHNAQYND